MKQGCLLLLVVWVGGFFGYQYLFKATEFEAMWWIPLLLGLCAAFVVGNVHGILLTLKQIRASKRPQSEWKDGDLVVLSGRIQTTRSPLVAPISGRSAVAVEYEVKTVTSDDSGGATADYRGCLMAPCTLHSSSGQLALVGFPILTDWPSDIFGDDASYKRLGEYFIKTKFEEMPKSPMALISQLNKVLKDDDGEVKADFRKQSVPDFATGSVSAATSNDDDDADPDATTEAATAGSFGPADDAAKFLSDCGYSLEETIIPNGAEVTAAGTYRAQKRQLNVGSGLTNVAHGIHKGSAQEVFGGKMRQYTIVALIFLAIFLTANYFLLTRIGIEPQELIKRMSATFGG